MLVHSVAQQWSAGPLDSTPFHPWSIPPLVRNSVPDWHTESRENRLVQCLTHLTSRA